MKPYIFLIFFSFYFAAFLQKGKAASTLRNYDETMDNHQVLKRFVRQMPPPPEMPPYNLPPIPNMNDFEESMRERRAAKGAGGYMPNRKAKLNPTKIKFPEKFKGTVLEKWADYWKNLFIDYRQMLQDIRSDVQEQPRKAFVWATGLTTLYGLVRNNPSEADFKDNFKRINNEVILVSEELLKPKSVEYLRFVDRCYNEGLVHYRNFGIASVIYISEINDGCDLYKSQCQYLKPTFFTFPSRVVDVGVLGRWWNIYIKTTNYDVNV